MENHVNMSCLQNMDEKRTQKVHGYGKYILGKIIIILYFGIVFCHTLP